MTPSLASITSPADLKKLTIHELSTICEQLRAQIIETLAITGGHLASNLGIVELTTAMHYVFESPSDKMIFDVSHQCYTHKLLTGRQSLFPKIRQYQGLCGFSHPKESNHDHFFAGHAGTALSLALGCAKSRDLSEGNEFIIPILGDASLTCGLTLEALNNIPANLKNFIVILNDNNMSISKNVGAVTQILSRIINSPASNRVYKEIEQLLSKIPTFGKYLSSHSHKLLESLKNLVSTAPFFEQFHLSYVGPIDGHDINAIISTLTKVKERCDGPVLIHVQTIKGQGMQSATLNPIVYHGARPYDKVTGAFQTTSTAKPTFPQIFGRHLLQMAKEDASIVAITPAMPAGSCLEPFMESYPERCIDVGIAEGHSVTFAGGIAKRGKHKVVSSIYATFLQRAFDNLFHDVCLQELPVVFAIDRAGISGPDGSTHHGIYDISFLNAMPNMVICQPRNGQLLKELLHSAFSWKRPTAIRYPNLPTQEGIDLFTHRALGQAEILKEGKDLLIVALGHMCETALGVSHALKEIGIEVTVVDPIFLKPIDSDLFLELFSSHKFLVTIEEHSLSSGLAMIISHFIVQNQMQHLGVLSFGIPDLFLDQGSHKELTLKLGLDVQSITQSIVTSFFPSSLLATTNGQL